MKTNRWFKWMAVWGGFFLITTAGFAQGFLLMPAQSTLTVPVPAGWSTFANNLNRGSNTLNEVLPQVADGTEIYRFNPATHSYSSSVYDEFSASWTVDFTLIPGQGAWIHSLVPQSVSITGQNPTAPPAARPPTSGLRFVGCRQPVASTFEEVMGFAPAEGDRMLLYEGSFSGLPNQPTRVFTLWNEAWTPTNPPLLDPGRSAFVDLVPPQPLIVQPPQNLTVNEGDPAAFTVVVTGERPLYYQWFENAVPVAGATSSTYSIGMTTASGSETNRTVVISVGVTNKSGVTVSSPAKLTIIPAGCLTIPHCPTNISTVCTISNGAFVTFGAWASNTCNSMVINLPCVPSSGSFFSTGTMAVHCSGMVAGQNVTCNFTVTVQSNCAPTIVSQPQTRSAYVSDLVFFTASVDGSPPLALQWRKNGTLLPGATLAYLGLTNVTASDAGAYSYVASNPYGNVTSADALLIVIDRLPPVQFNFANNHLTLQWGTNAHKRLQAADNPSGPWASLPGAGSPYVLNLIEARKFFRVVLP